MSTATRWFYVLFSLALVWVLFVVYFMSASNIIDGSAHVTESSSKVRFTAGGGTTNGDGDGDADGWLVGDDEEEEEEEEEREKEEGRCR